MSSGPFDHLEPGQREWLPCTPGEYFALPAYGSGAIRCFVLHGNLAFYRCYLQDDQEEKDSDSRRMGRVLHAAFEKPDAWRDFVSVIPSTVPDCPAVKAINDAIPAKSKAAPLAVGEEINTRKPTHRNLMALLKEQAEAGGKEWLTEEESLKVPAQIAAVQDNPACAELLSSRTELNVEVACVYRHQSGLLLKSLVDLLVGELIVDWKSTEATTPYGFIRQAKKLGYVYQAAHMCLVTGKDNFDFVSITNKPVYESNRFFVPPAHLETAKERVDQQVSILGQQMRTAAVEDEDSQGVPLNWHTELWGARMPLDEEMLLMQEAA